MILSLRIYWPFFFTERLFPFWYYLHKWLDITISVRCVIETTCALLKTLGWNSQYCWRQCQEYIEHCLLSLLQMVGLVSILLMVSLQKMVLAWEVTLNFDFINVEDPRPFQDTRRGQGLLDWKSCCAVTIHCWHHILIVLFSNTG